MQTLLISMLAILMNDFALQRHGASVKPHPELAIADMTVFIPHRGKLICCGTSAATRVKRKANNEIHGSFISSLIYRESQSRYDGPIRSYKGKFRPEDPKVQKALEYSLRAIVAEPKYDSFSLFRYAQLLEKCGKLHSAEDYYLMALEADPNNAGCLHCYGSFLSDKGLHEEAEEFFKRASQNTIGLKQWPQWYH